MVIGATAIYPFRYLIHRHPLLSALPTIFYAVCLAMILFGWMVEPNGAGVKSYEVLWYYPASSALGFILVLGCWKSFRWFVGPDEEATIRTPLDEGVSKRPLSTAPKQPAIVRKVGDDSQLP